jgi:hypothetical protein
MICLAKQHPLGLLTPHSEASSCRAAASALHTLRCPLALQSACEHFSPQYRTVLHALHALHVLLPRWPAASPWLPMPPNSAQPRYAQLRVRAAVAFAQFMRETTWWATAWQADVAQYWRRMGLEAGRSWLNIIHQLRRRSPPGAAMLHRQPRPPLPSPRPC